MRVYWELEGNMYKGDNITIAAGTKTHCKKVYSKMTDEQKQKYYFISLQPYDDCERLDFDETLYINKNI